MGVGVGIVLSFLITQPTTSRDVVKLPKKDGRVLDYIGKSSHRYYTHPSKPGKVTVPVHAGKDLPPGTLHAILKQAGLK